MIKEINPTLEDVRNMNQDERARLIEWAEATKDLRKMLACGTSIDEITKEFGDRFVIDDTFLSSFFEYRISKFKDIKYPTYDDTVIKLKDLILTMVDDPTLKSESAITVILKLADIAEEFDEQR